MNKNNFVNIVGYQFERVHTGVIKWILDTRNQFVPLTEKYKVIKRLFKHCQKPINFNWNQIDSINCTPEYSFGRRRKIDLVIEIKLTSGSTKYIVIEMKVDSIPYVEQLNGTFSDFTETITANEKDICFMLFLFGSSQVCEVPTNHVFSICKVNNILRFFENLNITDKIYIDWLESLNEEEYRLNNIVNMLSDTIDIWDEKYWKDKGYRPLFSLFYYIYQLLKAKSKNPLDWNIYSGSNNPVMNWTPGWENLKYKGKSILFYWEFNYQDFVLKVKVNEQDKLSHNELTALRKEVESICNGLDIKKGYRTQNRYGVYNSLYKWNFDFLKEDFVDIMSSTEKILDRISAKLKSTY
ncbi:PD-(D/E)XK nuclease family protein [Metabacillus idriensis]|uniref:PD-(D/E)XK nuclease family protein n=1 Tax=Metabacillus idriensis TaxID=324768 RepID=UPI00174CE089|nr:PD-(D/E)XK nuclease family protein [Metabacillus idriensis]